MKSGWRMSVVHFGTIHGPGWVGLGGMGLITVSRRSVCNTMFLDDHRLRLPASHYAASG